MCLAFCGAGPDGRPADQVGDVLGADGVEQFCRAGHAGLINLQQYGPGEFHSGGDVARTVQVGVVDEPLPTNCGTGFLEIGSHHD